MARDCHVLQEDAHNSFPSFYVIIFVVILVTGVTSASQNSNGDFMEDEAFITGNTSNWHHCPRGWTMFKKQCYKVIEASLTWTQAQTLCRSYGGNLVRIGGQCEQDWVSWFVRSQLGSASHGKDVNGISDNVADVPGVEAWIGFVQLPNKTFQWSDGQTGVEKDGFWAFDGLRASGDKSLSKLCCDIRESPVSKNLRWHLTDCEELHISVCELAACEDHTERCADGSKCFNKAWLCDGHWDCQDGSDEKNCLSTNTAGTQYCGAVLTGISGTFWSPNFPKDYPPFMNCVWKIKAEPPQIVEIVVRSLDIEEKYDILNIYEGTEINEQNLILSLGGQAATQTVRSLSSFLTIQFVSDHSVQGKGFNITWTAEQKPEPCGRQLQAGDEELLLSFSQLRLDSSHWSASSVLICHFLVSSPSNNGLLSLQFRNITLVSGDSITVHDGKGPDTPIITHITSAGAYVPGAGVGTDVTSADYFFSLNIPPVMTSSGQHLLLHVVTQRGSLSRFVVSYKNGCDAYISSSSSMILSPGYPRYLYPNNLNCTWNVSRDRLGRHLTLLFLPSFQTEQIADYVQVTSSETEQKKSQISEISGLKPGLQSGISSHHGFVIKFVSDSTVNRGHWAAVISYDCTAIEVQLPLMYNTSATRFGTTVGYSCSKGFQIVGATYSVCGRSGQWLPAHLPTCTEIDCGTVPVPPGAYLINVTGVIYGSHAIYKCMYGYSLAGSDVATCGEHGWEAVPSCQMITCPKECPPPGGTALAEDIRVGYLREYFCNPSLHLVGSKFSHCEITGHWTDQVPRCEARQCPDLYELLNGQKTVVGPVDIGRSVEFICDSGYRLLGYDELTCMDDLRFNYPYPSCVDIDECEKDVCGIHHCQNFIGGYSCFCNEGYQHLGNSTHVCVDIDECEVNNGGCSHECVNLPGKYRCNCPKDMSLYLDSWRQIGAVTLIPNKTCTATCKPLVDGETANVIYTQRPLSNNELLFGTEAYIVCPSGSYLSGASVVSCLPGKGWSASPAGCIEHSCEEPGSINNGEVSYSGLTLGSSVVYTCHKNHILQGPKKRYCIKVFNDDLQVVKFDWTGTEPNCKFISCPDLHNPVGGSVNFSSTTYSSVAVFRCQCGYQLIGQSVVKCMSDGTWSHPTPICQAQSCLHPGLPSQATIVEYKPGFLVQSLVRFRCVVQGYQPSNQDPLICLPYKETKVSSLKPSADLITRGHFVLADFVSMKSECIQTYRTEDLVQRWLSVMVQLCQAMNVTADVQKDTEVTLFEDSLNISVHIVVSSENTSATCQCHRQLLSYIMTLNLVKIINQDNSCPVVSLSLKSPLTITGQWFCGGGLRLEGEKQLCGNVTLPVCMEDCIDTGIETLNPSGSTPAPFYIETDSAGTDTSVGPETATSSSQPQVHSVTSATVNVATTTEDSNEAVTTSKLTNSATPVHSETTDMEVLHSHSTTASSNTNTVKDIELSTKLSSLSIATLETSSTTTSDFETTQRPLWSTYSSPLASSTVISTASNDIFRNSQYSPVNPTSSKPHQTTEYSATFSPSKGPSTRSPRGGETTQHTTKNPATTATINCTTYIVQQSLRNEKGQSDLGQEAELNRSNRGQNKEESAINDCLTTQSLEKQPATFGQGLSQRPVDLSAPAYAVEIHDFMWGSFANMSCIDAVHISINTKVNEVLREFGNEIGVSVCRDSQDTALELAGGNIRFKGSRAKIYIKFSITYSESSIPAVASCGRDFRDFISTKLPNKFDKVEMEVTPSDCKHFNYTRRMFNITFNGWSCHSGYILDEITFQCYRSPARGSFPPVDISTTTPTSTTSSPTPALTVPSWTLTFVGTFTTTQSEDKVDEHCIEEYKAALLQVLSVIERNLQSRRFKDIYMAVGKDVNISQIDRGVEAKVTVNLIPLQESVNYTAMYNCANFTSLQFRGPSQQIPSPDVYLSRCPVLLLSPHGLRTDISKVKWNCSPGYYISEDNFKCIDENLPLYSSGLRIVMAGSYVQVTCENITQTAAQILVETVFKQVHESLVVGNLCNTTTDVIILKEKGKVTFDKSEIIIFIPLTLVNLQRNHSETIDCVDQLYNYLRSILSEPIITMVNTLSNKCGANMTLPQNYVVPYKKWSCLLEREYNSVTHMCDSPISPAATGKEQSLRDRHKRDVVNFFVRPVWNSTVPTCIDVEAPVFHSCPLAPFVILLDSFSPNPVTIPWPKVTDNSGRAPIVTVVPDIWMPYRFTENVTVMMTAKDDSGNSAQCVFDILVIDETPPSIICPTELVTIYVTSKKNSNVTYKDAGVTASDNSGLVNVSYSPPEGSEVKAGEVIVVTASAVDRSFNMANCSFFTKAEIEGCAGWNLHAPGGVLKSCIPAETSNKETSCVVSCPAGKGFAVQPPELYMCSGKWQPHDRVPQCLEGSFPDYELQFSFHLSYLGNTTEECLKTMLDALIETVKSRILSSCENVTRYINLTLIDSVGTFSQIPLIKMEAKIKISIQQLSHIFGVTAAAGWCGETVLAQLELNGTLQRSCGQMNLDSPYASAGKNCCPEGFANVSSLCYECPAGSYLSQPTCKECLKDSDKNISHMVSCHGVKFDCPQGLCSTEPQCLACPVGMFQNTSGSSECIACQSGQSTLHEGAKDAKECLALCRINQYSPTGLEPCLPCALGTHQPKSGSRYCEACEFDNDGKSQFTYCKDPCSPGEYSWTGYMPCLLCPMNHYSQNNGSTTCTECSDNQVTRRLGRVSQADCEAYDPCAEKPCKHDSRCQPRGRDFTCECSRGYTGPKCEETLDLCDNHVCQNNGRCDSQGSGVTCICPPGFVGVMCEIPVIDHCLSNPCVFGSCMNTSTGFSCSCYSGFEGDLCEVKINSCAGVRCHNGACVDLVGYQCLCDEGFTGGHCEVKIDPCQENQCLNEGRCVNNGQSFTCMCPEGFTGDVCEVDVDDCASSPCLNGGLCQDGPRSFKCLCLPEHTGNRCESSTKACDLEPCVNEATCFNSEDTENDFYCKCKEGYMGERCEVDIDYCHTMPCSLEGSIKCENTDANFRCSCLPGWTGHLCDVMVDLCLENPCREGGTCATEGETVMCMCPPLFTGPTCAISLHSCVSSPCQNLGKCMEEYPGFLCQCRPGFTGSLCEVNIDECQSKPCLHGGYCQDGVNAFTCKCNTGFAGQQCEVDIDECLSQPCQHNSTCQHLQDDFLCKCNPGFTGKICDTEIDECNSDPCQNGGKCVDQVASFLCICPQGYTGVVCENIMEECQDWTCLNNGTCHKVSGQSLCQCTPYYTGPDCGKDKTANFDLYYPGSQSSASHAQVIPTGNLSELSICLWVKFSQPQSYGTYLVLTSEDDIDQFLLLRDARASVLVTAGEITLNVNDGEWHHICLVLTSHCTVFKDGQKLMQRDISRWTFGNSYSMKLKLGQPVVDSDDEWFRGHLHGVNLYSSALDEEEIFKMSQNCQMEKRGDLYNWITAESQLPAEIQVILPSQCNQIVCSPGSQSHLCSSLAEEDRVPPEVVNCPNTIVVTSEKDSVAVTWVEPEFSDNTGVVSVKQNFRSGISYINMESLRSQIFPYGQYLVTYIGYDAKNNSAECSFQIFVRRFNCVDPPPPANGARICGEWDQGRYCIPSCMQGYHFITPIPPFYRCGYEGIWNPPSGDPFAFPVCSRTYAPTHTIYGDIIFEGPECSSSFKNKLQEKIVHILSQLDSVLHLCGTQEVCSDTQGLNVKCGLGAHRRRRAVNQQGSVYNVTVNFTLAASMSDKQTYLDSMPEEIISCIKTDYIESDFILASDNLHLSSDCLSGQILINTDGIQCLSCPAGYFMSKKSVCSPCPRGSYSDRPLQTSCIQCAEGLTTSYEAATSSIECFVVCKSGSYFSVKESGCEPCPVGQYQNRDGESSCKPCPMGLSTHSAGAQSISDCQDICVAGQELGVTGTCVACPLGTYRSEWDTGFFCGPCSYGWTTENEGATDQTQCSIKKCDKGYYQNQEDKGCLPCPIGTFQESLGATSCEPCGVNRTTSQDGTDSRALCIPGKVNECQLKIDSCDLGAECVDQDDGFTCECKHGKTLTGQCVPDNCENYCSGQRYCSDEASVQDSECHCTVEMCRNDNSRDSLYKSLVTASIVITVLAVLILLLIIIVCLYKRNHQIGQEKHVRMYRDETVLNSFTNEAFDSFHTDDEVNLNEHSLQIPMKIATRWHNQSFVLTRPPAAEDDNLSADM